MASARKTFTRRGRNPREAGDEYERGYFLADLLSGAIAATEMHEIRDGQGRLVRIEYDDPNVASSSPRADQRSKP